MASAGRRDSNPGCFELLSKQNEKARQVRKGKYVQLRAGLATKIQIAAPIQQHTTALFLKNAFFKIHDKDVHI
jgi:hypothetical protein